MAKSLFDKTYIGKMKLKNLTKKLTTLAITALLEKLMELTVMKVLIILKKEQKVALV